MHHVTYHVTPTWDKFQLVVQDRPNLSETAPTTLELTIRTANQTPVPSRGYTRRIVIVEWNWTHPSQSKLQRLVRRYAARETALCTTSTAWQGWASTESLDTGVMWTTRNDHPWRPVPTGNYFQLLSGKSSIKTSKLLLHEVRPCQNMCKASIPTVW